MNSFFFSSIEENTIKAPFIEKIENFSKEHSKQIYLIDNPLQDKDSDNQYEFGFALLSPGHKIIFINTNPSEQDVFEEYFEDFIDDIFSLVKKYKFLNTIGRPRIWEDDVTFKHTCIGASNFDISALMQETLITERDRRISEIIISLLTGSINDSDKVHLDYGGDSLQRIKQKILMFDGEQTRFIYSNSGEKKTVIQGMSGTGKTELLLHKLKEIYEANEKEDIRICFTCHNEILAFTLRERLPQFFNYMRVESQIEWNKKLWCMRAWGSESNQDSGVYSKICRHYGIDFIRFSFGTSFESVCKRAYEEIEERNLINDKGYLFDYFFVDESQDFGQHFFSLIDTITKNKVYAAGDIFQNIFEDYDPDYTPDFLLNKCYRTDPRTLMFAHSIGLGLFEKPKLRWLTDEQWKAYGYNIEVNGDQYKLSREKLLRFEDINDNGESSIELVNSDVFQPYGIRDSIITIINDLKNSYESFSVNDIAIVFLANKNNSVVEQANHIAFSIEEEFGWEANIAFESREKVDNRVFISTRNHVKGLEFPFVICVANNLQTSQSYRNSLYMLLTRSFLKSYLVLSDNKNPGIIERYNQNLEIINDKNRIEVTKPSEEEIAEMDNTLKIAKEEVINIRDSVISILKSNGIEEEDLINSCLDFVTLNVNKLNNKSLITIESLVNIFLGSK